MQLIDIGANLAHDSFDDDRDALIQRAAEAGVQRMIVTGSSNESNRKTLQLCEQYPDRLFATAGVHPHHASDLDAASISLIEECAAHPANRAIGECGLDYNRNFSPREDQLNAFEAQLEIAARLSKPVFLHQRDALDDFVAVLKPWLGKFPYGVAHCFTDHKRELHALLDLDLYIGITGWICDERRGAHLLDIVSDIPKDRLMIETDAPYLLPRSLRPKPKTRRNEPQWLPEVARVVASARNTAVEDLAQQTTATAEQFFDLPEYS